MTGRWVWAAMGLGCGGAALASAAACAASGGDYQGRVTFADGRPIPGVEVDIGGVNAQSARTGSSAMTDGAGRYSVHMGPGRYHPSYVVYKINYNGKQYWVDFDQTVGPKADAPAKGSIRCDFVLRLKGPLAPDSDPNDPGAHFGAAVRLDLAAGSPMSFKGWPPGAELEVTLTPLGPLLDGSAGQTLTLRQPATDPTFKDIPVGRYALAARLIDASGAATPLRAAQGMSGAPPAAQAVINFPPHYGVRTVNTGPNAEMAMVYVQP